MSNMRIVKGNTYPIKDRLKMLGGKWDAKLKVWRVPDDKYDEAMALLSPQRSQPQSKYSPSLGCDVPMTTWYEFEEHE